MPRTTNSDASYGKIMVVASDRPATTTHNINDAYLKDPPQVRLSIPRPMINRTAN